MFELEKKLLILADYIVSRLKELRMSGYLENTDYRKIIFLKKIKKYINLDCMDNISYEECGCNKCSKFIILIKGIGISSGIREWPIPIIYNGLIEVRYNGPCFKSCLK